MNRARLERGGEEEKLTWKHEKAEKWVSENESQNRQSSCSSVRFSSCEAGKERRVELLLTPSGNSRTNDRFSPRCFRLLCSFWWAVGAFQAYWLGQEITVNVSVSEEAVWLPENGNSWLIYDVHITVNRWAFALIYDHFSIDNTKRMKMSTTASKPYMG